MGFDDCFLCLGFNPALTTMSHVCPLQSSPAFRVLSGSRRCGYPVCPRQLVRQAVAYKLDQETTLWQWSSQGWRTCRTQGWLAQATSDAPRGHLGRPQCVAGKGSMGQGKQEFASGQDRHTESSLVLAHGCEGSYLLDPRFSFQLPFLASSAKCSGGYLCPQTLCRAVGSVPGAIMNREDCLLMFS